MAVPPLDLKRQLGPMREEILAAFARVLDSGQFILGPDVAAFEKEIGEFLGVDYALGVSNGTDALWIALKGLNVGPGDEVLTSPFTFFATISAILHSGATPRFADIEAASFNLDPNFVEDQLKRDNQRRIKVIMPVHLYGQSADMEAFRYLRQKFSVALVEDAAQAIGAEFQGKRVGGFGDITTFSFFPTKNLGALGDAGLVTTNDVRLFEKMKMVREHGSQKKYYHDYLGSNCRIDTIHCAALRVLLPHLGGWIQERQAIALKYDGAFSTQSEIVPPSVLDKRNHVYHQYTLRVLKGKRDALSVFLVQNNIAHAVYYPIPCHLQVALKEYGFQPGQFPVAETAAKEVLSIPVFPGMEAEETQDVIDALLAWQA